jgi:hypothetical protein
MKPCYVDIEFPDMCGCVPQIDDMNDYGYRLPIHQLNAADMNMWSILSYKRAAGYSSLVSSGLCRNTRSLSLLRKGHQSEEKSPYRYSIGPPENQIGQVPTWMVPFGLFCVGCGLYGISRSDGRATTILAWAVGLWVYC